jgi:predicted PurR-regulated permease PerM
MSVSPIRSESTLNAIWRLLLRLSLVAGIIYACYRLRTIITTLFVAAIVAYVLEPLVSWLCRDALFIRLHDQGAAGWSGVRAAYTRILHPRREPQPRRTRMTAHSRRLLATLYVFICAALVMWQGMRLVTTPFVNEFKAAASPAGRAQIHNAKVKFLTWYEQTTRQWDKSGKVKQMVMNSDILKSAQGLLPAAGLSVLESAKNIVELVLLPVLAFYFVIDGRTLKHEFVVLLPKKRIREALRIIHEFNLIMRAFVSGQFILCTLAGVVVGVGLAWLHVSYSLILGLLAGVTRAIPIIGPIIGGIPIILLTLATKGPTVALAVLFFFSFLHFAESKFIMPWLIGDRVELHPVIIIVVLLVGGEVGGLFIGGQIGALLGMFFAAPVASIVRVLIRRYWLRVPPGRHKPGGPSQAETYRTPAAVTAQSAPQTSD